MIADGRLKSCVVGASTRITQEELDRFVGSRIEAAKEKALEESKLIPRDILKKLEREMLEITHGTVFLTIHLRDHHPRFEIGRKQSFLPEDAAQGSYEGIEPTDKTEKMLLSSMEIRRGHG
jgi:hypothetical protein